MPMGSKKSETQPGNASQDRPVIFQKYFKAGGRTYASQVKVANNGRKYLVLTEGVRDHETQEVKKHIIRVFESDLKEFFALLQETVLFLRSAKDPSSTIAGVVPPKPAGQLPAPTPAKPSRPAPPPAAASVPAAKTPPNGTNRITPPAKAPSNGTAKPAPARLTVPTRPTKPVSVPVATSKVAKPPYRPAGRPSPR